jgi:hypothetical protein
VQSLEDEEGRQIHEATAEAAMVMQEKEDAEEKK